MHCFWFLRSDAGQAEPQPVVADGRLEIILHCAEPFSRVENGRSASQGDALLAGQLTAPVHLLQRGVADVVGIRLRTAAAGALFRQPTSELTNQIEPLAQLAPGLRDRLLSAVQRPQTPEGRRSALTAVLLRYVMASPDGLALAAVRQLDRPAPPRLTALAASLGVSLRSLERRVGLATGLAPRTLVRSLRFRRVFRQLEAAAPGTMTRIALDAGYFDQAHCVREFRRYAGQSPAAFFRHEPALASAFLEGAIEQ